LPRCPGRIERDAALLRQWHRPTALGHQLMVVGHAPQPGADRRRHFHPVTRMEVMDHIFI
jgi:hypothetical protein